MNIYLFFVIFINKMNLSIALTTKKDAKNFAPLKHYLIINFLKISPSFNSREVFNFNNC